MGLLDGILKGVENSILGPDPAAAASAYKRLQDELSSGYNQKKQAFEANPENKGKQYQMPDAVTRWSDQINAMIISGDPILQQNALQQLGQYQQRATSVQSGTDAPTSVREYQYAQLQGYQGSFQDWLRAKAEAGRSSINVNIAKQDQPMSVSDAKQVVLPNGELAFGMTPNQAREAGGKIVLSDTQRQAGTAGDVLAANQQLLEQNLNPSRNKVEAVTNELRTMPNVVGTVINAGMNLSGVPMSDKAAKFELAKGNISQQQLKLMSGASATESEMQQYRDKLPKFTDSPAVQRLKFQQATQFADSVIQRNSQAGIKPSSPKPASTEWTKEDLARGYRVVK